MFSVRPRKSQTRLRQLAVTCEFADVDREIKTQIVQSCSSHKLRTKALENPSYFLTQLLDAGRAMELSQKQAANIEESQTVNTFPIYTFKNNCIWVLFLMAPFPSMTMWTMCG